MKLLVAVLGTALVLLVLRDAFETVVLPRRVRRFFRLTSIFYRASWYMWRGVARRFKGVVREVSLSTFGPLSLLLLLALWAFGIVLGFGALHWAAGSALIMPGQSPGFLDDLYLSGTTFFTLGLGDVTPGDATAKVLTVIESGLGFAFLAIIISYLPVIYQAFSRREISISMLDARAGSPPGAGELLRRNPIDADPDGLSRLLGEWERWSAEILESHLSYPVLAYYRSQHGNQSWLAALATVLDTSALVMVGCEGPCARQARFTFAMARHAVVDLAQVFSARRPRSLALRISETDLARLAHELGAAGARFETAEARARFVELRMMYEPYLTALSEHLVLPVPGWSRHPEHRDNWEAAPWKDFSAKAKPPEHF